MKRNEATRIERKALLMQGTTRTLILIAVVGAFVAISKLGGEIKEEEV